MSIRLEKVASVIKKVIAGPINELALEKYPGSLVTVTNVRLTKDLRLAYIHLSFYGKDISPGSFLDNLEDNKPRLRSLIGSQVRLRFTPDLKFFIDDSLDQIEHIQNLLDSMKNPKQGDDSKDLFKS